MSAQQDQVIVHENKLHTQKPKVENSSVPSITGQEEPQLLRAAFYDVDGTIISSNVLHPYAYYAASAPTISGKLGRLFKLGASLPLYALTERKGRKLFNDMFYMNYKGLSEDRLYVLGQEIFENFLKNKIFNDMQHLIKESQNQGMRQILITGNLDTVIAPLAEYLGVDDWVANRLEFDQDGLATGKLVPPILAGPEKAYWLRSYAKKHGINLDESHAYADSASDIPLLCAVGHPVAVNPDSRLKATADAHNWSIIRTKSI